VLPSHGEGWGAPYMEAAAMGLPSIATNWSGMTEFLGPHNALLLDDFELEPAGNDAWFAGGRLASQQQQQLRCLPGAGWPRLCWPAPLLASCARRQAGPAPHTHTPLFLLPWRCRASPASAPAATAAPAAAPERRHAAAAAAAGAQWAKPSVPELRRAMRRLYRDRALAARLGVAAREGVIQKYDNEKVRGAARGKRCSAGLEAVAATASQGHKEGGHEAGLSGPQQAATFSERQQRQPQEGPEASGLCGCSGLAVHACPRTPAAARLRRWARS
jgi:hypothetical protein